MPEYTMPLIVEIAGFLGHKKSEPMVRHRFTLCPAVVSWTG